MKSVIILTLFALVALGECQQVFRKPSREERQQIHKKCVAEGKIDQELEKQYLKKNFPSDEKTQCYVKCYMEASGLFKNNYFNVPAWKEFLLAKISDSNAVNRGLAECIDIKSNNFCTTAYEGFKCLGGKGLLSFNPTFANKV